jgi:phosphatidylglycerol lysyltransferase
MQRAGVTFRIMERDEVTQRLSELRIVSDEWLAQKSTSEKSFSIGYFDEAYLKRFRCAVAELDGAIIGFANLFESEAKSELSIDLMRYRREVPNGVMDFLFISLFEWGRDNGYKTFSLGMTPLAGLPDNPLAPNYAKLANLIYRHGGHFYNFEGLRKYKDKFHPTWQARYLACPSGLYLPIVLSNVSTLISGGFKGLVRK